MDNEQRIKLLKYLQTHRYSSLDDIAELMSISKTTAKRYCDELQKENAIYRENNNSPWEVCIDIEDYHASPIEEIDLTKQKLTYGYLEHFSYSNESEITKGHRSKSSYRSVRNNLSKNESIRKYRNMDVKSIKKYYFLQDNIICNRWIITKSNNEPLFKHQFITLEKLLEDSKNSFLSLEKERDSAWNHALNIICNDILKDNETLDNVLEHYILMKLFIEGKTQYTEKQLLHIIEIELNNLFEFWTQLSTILSPENCYEVFQENDKYKAIYWIFWCIMLDTLETGKIGRLPVILSIKE